MKKLATAIVVGLLFSTLGCSAENEAPAPSTPIQGPTVYDPKIYGMSEEGVSIQKVVDTANTVLGSSYDFRYVKGTESFECKVLPNEPPVVIQGAHMVYELCGEPASTLVVAEASEVEFMLNGEFGIWHNLAWRLAAESYDGLARDCAATYIAAKGMQLNSNELPVVKQYFDSQLTGEEGEYQAAERGLRLYEQGQPVNRCA